MCEISIIPEFISKWLFESDTTLTSLSQGLTLNSISTLSYRDKIRFFIFLNYGLRNTMEIELALGYIRAPPADLL